MIYQIIRSPTLRPFPGLADSEDCIKWENEVCQKVVDYTLDVWKELGKPPKVYLGIDGVVPMAKIRQQRLRRFKSIWTAGEEAQRGLRDPLIPRWDTNAITPGTEFMDRLGKRLQTLCEIQNWTFEGVGVQGEGEQKCMDFWRKNVSASPDNIVIYGLDADLILLCLLNQQLLKQANQSIWCFRETAEWEGGAEKGLAPFMRLSINRLHQAIRNGAVEDQQWILDYVASMSFLGNDFVPHGLSLKIREGGHEQMTESLRQLHKNKQHLIRKQDEILTYDIQSTLALCRPWADREDQNILQFIKRKSARKNLEDWNMLPCEWAHEQKTLCQPNGGFRKDWKEKYYSEWFGATVTPQQVCRDYAIGLQWVLDYYTKQRPTDVTWIYPWSLPPLWSDWCAFLSSCTSFLELERPLPQIQIQPKEQLAMVLPLESWHLVTDKKLAALPRKLPHFWPKSYGFFSVGRLFLWECEAELPLLHLPTIRSDL